MAPHLISEDRLAPYLRRSRNNAVGQENRALIFCIAGFSVAAVMMLISHLALSVAINCENPNNTT